MHLRKLVPLAELLARRSGAQVRQGSSAVPQVPQVRCAASRAGAHVPRTEPSHRGASARDRAPAATVGTCAAAHLRAAWHRRHLRRRRRPEGRVSRRGEGRRKSFFYNTVVAQAYRIDVTPVAHHVHVPAESEACRSSSATSSARGSKSIAEKVAGTQDSGGGRRSPTAPRRLRQRRRPRRAARRTAAHAGSSDEELRQRSAWPIPRCRRCSRSSRSRRPRSKRCRQDSIRP